MSKKDIFERFLNGVIVMFVAFGLLLLIALLSSCRTIKYVPVNTVKTEYRYRTDSVRDSIYLRDSIYVNQYTRGDTVFRDRIQTRYQFRNLYKTVKDTVNLTDSIRVPYPVPAQLTRWQKAKQAVGGWAMVVALALVVYLIGRILWKKIPI